MKSGMQEHGAVEAISGDEDRIDWCLEKENGSK
jgi:hypothetical protein